jgi:hypothetical protein
MNFRELKNDLAPLRKTQFRNALVQACLLLAAMAALSGLSACSSASTEPVVEKTCRELGAELRSTVGGENPAYKVLSPNSVETFTTGQTLKIKVIAADDADDALIHIRFVDQAGTTHLALWPGQTEGLNLQESCEHSLILPDSIAVGSIKVRLISDKVKIRVSNYSTSSFRDESDTTFTIKAP